MLKIVDSSGKTILVLQDDEPAPEAIEPKKVYCKRCDEDDHLHGCHCNDE